MCADAGRPARPTHLVMGRGDMHLARIGRVEEDDVDLLAHHALDVGGRLGQRLLGLLEAHELGYRRAAVGKAASTERERAGDQRHMSNNPQHS